MTVSMRLTSQVAAFLLCLFVVSGTSCPEKEDLYPCECEEVDSGLTVTCSGERIHQQDIKRALSRMRGNQIAILKLEALENVRKLKGDLFDGGHDILELDIDNCDIEELTDGEKPAFSGLEDSLKVLSISNSLKSSASLKLSHLRNLLVLKLFGNKVQELEEECFPDSLTVLWVRNTEIKSVADRVFANLDKLFDVELNSIKFSTFKRSWFPVPSTILNCLAFINNNLTSLPRDAFSDMPSLWQVELQNNGLRTMDVETWAGVFPQLDRIDMRGNPLACDTNMKWLRQVELKGYILGNCQGSADPWGTGLAKWIREDSSE